MKAQIILASALLNLFNTGCTTTNTNQEASIILNSTKQACAAPEATFTKIRNPILFTSGEQANTCLSYFDLKQSSEIDEDVNNMIAAQDYVICDTVKAVQHASKNRFESSGINTAGAHMAERIVLDSFPSSLFQRTDADHKTEKQIFGSNLNIGRYSVVADTPEWHYGLQLHAVLDINGDGLEDWIIWLTDRAKNGDYSVVAGFYVISVANKGPLKMMPLRKLSALLAVN
ncbi:hypothetical protein [Teredinibacter haidensis]|uniref:hypothetical protein n=1 Tax=Teredinibacter haidensis TaxID=2731755 RepID=UPI00094909B4|nr:hypothetical protein [Teredinibacter haidensis]